MTSSGPEVMKAWRAAEKESLSRLGLRRIEKDRYLTRIDDQGSWEGTISLPKKIAARGSGRVDLDPIGFALTHKPSQELIHTLKGTNPIVTMPGLYWEVLPAELNRKLTRLWINDPIMIDDATKIVAGAIRDHVLPWMRSNATPEKLIQYLNQPPKMAHLERSNFEYLAAVNYQLERRDDALRALDMYGSKFGKEEEVGKFIAEFRRLLA